MAKLIYSAIASVDGYVEDEAGRFDWSMPDEEVHRFVNDLERPIGTYLYGRRMWETMRYWGTPESVAGGHAIELDYAAIWRAADKIVYSRSLDSVAAERTRLEHSFDPDAVAALKGAAGSDLSVGGAELAGQALAAGLVDEVQLFLVPVAVGGGKPALPPGGRLQLRLMAERAFANGTVFLRYSTGDGNPSL
jgi:dihydrofolate reductase